MTGQQRQEVVPLDLLDPPVVRRRAWSVALGALLVAAAFGGIVGLFGGVVAGLVTAAVIGLPLLLLALVEARRRTWLADGTLAVRGLGTRRVALAGATLDLLVTDTRGVRTIGMLVSGRGRAINLALAMYAGTGGRELGIVQLRRLADALAATGEASGLVFSQLLVAQLRAEARGDAAPERPLYQIASLAPGGRLAQKLTAPVVARFVTTLD
ncbi:hypothetical protein LX15_002088 [Streptoalloteichus tenebrarius]|uniref:Integral membrane protein n=1 Tax=Streptoalloteichus tenebrarius (strain ATCC 17920 / DSM 40477 / JCM 4838 / CBS 697.72 / NBRC 16177 / NCIMB 11028 / NRRL B-12390 / A12253. 1 / ISP 5477) TaxID=1933 RepID=A0ABT1HSA0_STRSD|nr:hypothetical protein [Streptoalloteichus tenebrarius]MCP2258394.1 hypothetical protein [Streptoalloteichus tenebrarius]BFF03562.1 hypothetical protein GCM10020241_52370 [Streptoalloteichus tenebrarius]